MRNSRDTGIWSKGQNNENKNQYKNTDLRDQSTLELLKTHIHPLFWYIKELLVQKYQTIVVSTELSHPSPEMSNSVPKETRQFGTKKVRYQDKSALHFLSNKRDYLL